MNKQLEIYLSEIAEQLWKNRVSLFIGSGFSLNAISEEGVKSMPLWNDLGDMFFKKIYGRAPKFKDKAYVNVMRLADDVENVFGRNALNEMITDAISDNKRKPSDLYYTMLSLPWTNIYTTNFDSLLERAAQELQMKGGSHYSLFVDEKSLPSIESPYIAKLHGDLNNPDGMIITEEDYRNYPNNHKVFINEVKNAFMKNTIVVIGFSGDDPNFIQWLGWIRDNLGRVSRRVYLITISKMSIERIRTLEKKNINVVDITGMAKTRLSIYDNLNAFFSFLYKFSNEIQSEEDNFSKKVLMWGKDVDSFNRHETDYMKLYETWHTERLTYPGWIVMPRDKREYLMSIDAFSLSEDYIKLLERPYDILFLNEFNWRIEKCLFPIYNEWEAIYLSVINKYNPIQKTSDKDLLELWFNLKLALLRLYRQENWEGKWNVLKDDISTNIRSLSDDQYARFKYELCQHAIYIWDFPLLESILDDWPQNLSLPYWEIKKAALWAEFFSLDKGKAIAKDALDEISLKYNSCSYEEKYFWASRKNAAHSIINIMNSTNFSSNKESNLNAQKTWADLKKYDDIWYERDFFDARLRNVDEVSINSKKIPQFELGRYRITTFIDRNSFDYRIAYAFFNYYEELGYPIHLSGLITIKKETLSNALSLMAYCSQAIAETWMLRFSDIDLVASVFSRKKIKFTSSEEINGLFEKYLRAFQKLPSIDDSDRKYWVSNMKSVIPEVLSRLSVKASYKLRVDTFRVINELYCSSYIMSYRGVDKLVSRLMSTFTDKEEYELIPYFIEMPIVDNINDSAYLYDPMSYMSVNKHLGPLDIKPELISEMINAIAQGGKRRSVSVTRMSILYRLNLLDKNQICKFSEALWKHTEEGFPIHTIYNKFVFLYLPHPVDINPSKCLAKYFETHGIAYNSDDSISILFRDPVVNNIKGTLNDDVDFEWEANALEKLVTDICVAWSHDKKLLFHKEKSFGLSISDEYRSRFIDIGKIISGVLVKNKHKLSAGTLERLKSIIDEFPKYGIPSYSIMSVYPEWYSHKDLVDDFCKKINSYDKFEIVDCLTALIQKSKCGMDVKNELEYIMENFRCNRDIARINLIQTISYFIMNNKELFTDKAIKNLLLGLKSLFEFTKIEKTDSEFTVNDKLNICKEVAIIISALLETPSWNLYNNETLLSWKSYYKDEETFNDVKNKFLS